MPARVKPDPDAVTPAGDARPKRNVSRIDYAALDTVADHVFAAEVAGERVGADERERGGGEG